MGSNPLVVFLGTVLISMDREYIRKIVERLCREREDKRLSPTGVDINRVINAVREDVLGEMRKMCDDHVLVACRTLNGAAVKLYGKEA